MELLGREVQPASCGTAVSLAALLVEFFDQARQAKNIAELNVAAGIIHEELQALLGVYVDALPSLLN